MQHKLPTGILHHLSESLLQNTLDDRHGEVVTEGVNEFAEDA
jgi:hypothetical protein